MRNGYRKEWMWENYNYLQSPASTRLVRLQSLVCVWKESSSTRKVLRKGLDVGLSKQQISNLFNSQESLGDISPLTAIEKFSGARNGKTQAAFYDDCQSIPYPLTLENLLLLDDCFLCKQNKAEAYYTQGRHNNCDTIYIALLPTTSTYSSRKFKFYYPVPRR